MLQDGKDAKPCNFLVTNPSRPGRLRRITHFGLLHVKLAGYAEVYVQLLDGATLPIYLQYALEAKLGRFIPWPLKQALRDGEFVWSYCPDRAELIVYLSGEAIEDFERVRTETEHL